MMYFRMGATTRFHSWFHPLRWFRKVAFVLAVTCTCCLLMSTRSTASAQDTGNLHGVTRNAQGAPLPGARVVVHNIAENTDQNFASDNGGGFQVGNLRPGRYRLTASKDGVGGSSVLTVDLAPGQDLRIVMTIALPRAQNAAVTTIPAADAHWSETHGDLAETPLTEREKLLLERLNQLEQRLAALEARESQPTNPSSTPAGSVVGSLNQEAPQPAGPPSSVPAPSSASAPTVATTKPSSVAPVNAETNSPAAPIKHTLLASLEGAVGVKSAEKAPAISITPSKQAATAAPPAAPALQEAMQPPDPAPPNSDNVYTWADYTWLNGTPRNKDTVLDTKYFTPEVRFDTHFMEDFNQPRDHTMGGATESFRSGEIQVEQISVGGDFHWKNVRGRVLYMDGLFATTTPRNDASAGVGEWDIQGAYKYVSEAYGGYHFNVNHGLNVDAGIFVSYIGLFSYYNFDNWIYQPSFVSSNTPWFFNGVRIQWYPTKKLKIEPWIINGWQSYNKYNSHLGLGGQLLWRPKEWMSLVFNQYGYGQDNLGVPKVQRIHTDDSIEVKYYDHPKSRYIDKAAFSLTGDLGCQYGPGYRCTGGATKDSFAGWMGYNRVWFGKDKYAISYGGGKMNNPGRYLTLLPPINEATAVTGSPYFTENAGQPAHMWDTSLGFQWMPREYITWWLESGYRHSDVPYWTGRHGITPPGGNNGFPAAYVCNSGAAAYTAINNTNLDLADATTFCASNGNGGVWFPDLRKSQAVVSAGIMVKF
jgi:hypothetical protein